VQEGLNHDPLEAGDKGNRQPEVIINFGKDFLKNINFSLSNLSAVEVVEHLRENECAEYISEQLSLLYRAPERRARLSKRLVTSLDFRDSIQILIAFLWIFSIKLVTVVAE
jgi:hypothetical protein